MASYNATNQNQINHSSDHIYFDISIRNYASPNVENEIPLTFSTTRDVPILNNAKDYLMSVIRFKLDTFLLPCLFFQVKRDQPDVNLGEYTLTLEWDDGINPVVIGDAEHVIWVPQKVNAQIPTAPNLNPNGLQDFTEYYYVQDYQYMILLINNAINSAMAKLQALTGVALSTVEPPFLVWNDDQTCTIYARESHFDSSAAAKVNIYFNRPLMSLFSTWTYRRFNLANSNNRYFQLIMERYSGQKVVNLPNFGIDNLIFQKQQFETIDNWSPIASLVFLSNTIPINANQLSTPTVFIDGQQRQLTDVYKNFANIVTDISSNELGYKPDILYNPTAQYRFVDLTNDMPLTQIDFTVMWIDKLGIMRPLSLPPNASCSMKILFKKKGAD